MSSVKFVLSLATLLTASMLSQIFPNSAQASERMDRPEHSSRASQNTIRLAQAASEKEAFEGAKELGTLEAWEAFLNSFPKGFRADLARAYVRRLGNETKATPAPAPTPAQVAPPPPVAPPPQPVVQTPTPPPPPPPAAVLQPIHLGPDASPWGNGNYAMDEGNASAFSASVRSSGLEFTTYCTANRLMHAVVGEANRGVYPQFDQRVEQGLTASREQYGTPEQRISIRFTNGNEHILPASVMGLTGEMSISSDVTRGGFRPGGTFINDMMSSKSFTISSPPFGVTFQLNNSRRAICSVLKQCGVSTSGCARFQQRPVSTYRPPVKKTYTKKKSGCPGGTVFLEGQCIKNSQVTSFCGPGYKRSGSKCISRYPANPGQSQSSNSDQEPSSAQQLQGIIQQIFPGANKSPCPSGLIRNAYGQCAPDGWVGQVHLSHDLSQVKASRTAPLHCNGSRLTRWRRVTYTQVREDTHENNSGADRRICCG
jgi:hypothetical protein